MVASALDRVCPKCLYGHLFVGATVPAAAAKSLQSCPTLCVARQSPLSMEFPRPEYWNGLPFSPPGDLPNWQESNLPMSLALAGGFFTTEPCYKRYNQSLQI